MELRSSGRLLGMAVSAAIVFGACSAAGSSPTPAPPSQAAPASQAAAPASQAAPASRPLPPLPLPPAIPRDLAAAEQAGVLAKGPHGESAQPASDVTLTAAELAKVKGMHATAAIALHYGGNDWSTAQVAGLKHEFGLLGIKVIAVTDANFVAATQVSDIETLITKKPNIIVSIPVDPVATASAYKKAAAAGIKLVFMDNVPQGFKAGVDYVSDVSADNYGNGVVAAQLLAKAINGKGTIGLVYHQADFFVTHERYLGFKNTIEKYPGIKIVCREGHPGPELRGAGARRRRARC